MTVFKTRHRLIDDCPDEGFVEMIHKCLSSKFAKLLFTKFTICDETCYLNVIRNKCISIFRSVRVILLTAFCFEI